MCTEDEDINTEDEGTVVQQKRKPTNLHEPGNIYLP